MNTNYCYEKDEFYKNHPVVYATFFNVWFASTEGWHEAKAYSQYNAKIKVNGEYVTPDSALPEHREVILNQAKDAGINAAVMDLTNGHTAYREFCKDYQRLCFENGMKFSVDVNPGRAPLEEICKYVWETFADPESAEYSQAYLYKDGKPLLVLYAVEPLYIECLKADTEYANKFTFAWGCGNNHSKLPFKDAWAWQLIPTEGPSPSDDSVLVTNSVKWYEASCASWRKSIAFLDFCFLAAREKNPKFIIISSIDDETERNGWMKMDTSKVVDMWRTPAVGDDTIPEVEKTLQMRDIYGNLSETAYFDRVKSWINGTVKPYHADGVIADGAYTLVNAGNGKQFGTDRPVEENNEVLIASDENASFQRDNIKTDMESYYWFYHLGNDEYSVIKLTSTLNLEDSTESGLVQNYAEDKESQRWKVTKISDGKYQIINKATGKAICDENGADTTIVTAKPDSGDSKQLWNIKAVPNRTF